VTFIDDVAAAENADAKILSIGKGRMELQVHSKITIKIKIRMAAPNSEMQCESDRGAVRGRISANQPPLATAGESN
jgi:hypothetical protein